MLIFLFEALGVTAVAVALVIAPVWLQGVDWSEVKWALWLKPWLAPQRVVVLDVQENERSGTRLVTYKRSVGCMAWRHSVAEFSFGYMGEEGEWTLRDGRVLGEGWQRTHMTWAYKKWERMGEERERAELMEGRIQEHTKRLLASGVEG